MGLLPGESLRYGKISEPLKMFRVEMQRYPGSETLDSKTWA
jgi:hypothetical protein